MIRCIPDMSPLAAREHVVRDNETETFRSDYTPREIGVPQLLLVEQPIPGSAILPHFHSVDQFQVFVGGSGRLGAHEVVPLAVHYTNKYTSYGPIVAGPEGFSYYVFRPSFAHDGSFYLHVPGVKEQLRAAGGKRRTLVARDLQIAAADALAARSDIGVTRVIAPATGDDDGVFADLVALGPNMAYTAPDPASGGGQVVLLLAGRVECRGEALAGRAGIAVEATDPAVALAAGREGAQFLVLQYPRPQ